jgi:hypothetical protein
MDEKLKSTLDKVIRLTQQNDEFGTELRKGLNVNFAIPLSSLTDDRINQIFEYCIEDIIRKQAEEFYAGFPILSIVTGLQDDYVRMESFRRKDSFPDFCIALYQQIEWITNKLCEQPKLNEIAEKMWGYCAYVKEQSGTTDFRKRNDSDWTIAKLIFGSKAAEKSKVSLQAQYAIDKVYSVIYFVGYKSAMLSSDYKGFVEIKNLMSDIYQCRNMNHRGNKQTEWEEKTLNRILPLKSYYYFRFMGALAQYVNYVKNGYSCIDEIYDYCKTLDKKPIRIGPNIVDKIPPDELERRSRKR